MIAPDGYNRGRDIIVDIATREGGTRYRNREWTSKVEWVEGLLRPGRDGINHDLDQDGRVAILTVTEY